MTELKRPVIKYLRDILKKDYNLCGNCYICGSPDKIELHHLYGLSELFNNWCDKNKIKEITTVEQINSAKYVFAEECNDKLSNKNLYLLCKMHHTRLHSIYGQRYSNHLVPKIKNWLQIQKDKHGK